MLHSNILMNTTTFWNEPLTNKIKLWCLTALGDILFSEIVTLSNGLSKSNEHTDLIKNPVFAQVFKMVFHHLFANPMNFCISRVLKKGKRIEGGLEYKLFVSTVQVTTPIADDWGDWSVYRLLSLIRASGAFTNITFTLERVPHWICIQVQRCWYCVSNS